MSVSLGFISYTISVLKAILPVSIYTPAENLPDGNTEIGTLSLPGADNFPVQESQLNEILAQATSKLLENTNLNLENASAGLSPVAFSDSRADELNKSLKDSISAAVKGIEKLDQKPIEEYEDVLVTEYFLKYYYGQQDYIKFKQKIDVVEFKNRIDTETELKKKFQEDLLKRQQQNLQKDEIEKINLRAIRDFQERMISDKLKDNKEN